MDWLKITEIHGNKSIYQHILVDEDEEIVNMNHQCHAFMIIIFMIMNSDTGMIINHDTDMIINHDTSMIINHHDISFMIINYDTGLLVTVSFASWMISQ